MQKFFKIVSLTTLALCIGEQPLLHAELGYAAGSVNGTYAPAVFIIDTTHNTVTGTVSDPHSYIANSAYLPNLSFSPDGKTVYVPNEGGNVIVIDVATNAASSLIQNNSGTPFAAPSWAAFSPDGSKAYISDSGNSKVYIIDTATNTTSSFVSSGTLTAFSQPKGIVFGLDGSFAYVADSVTNQVYVIDTATDTATSYVGVSQILPAFDSPVWLTLSPDGTYAYVTNTEGEAQGVYVIDTTSHVSTKQVVLSSNVPADGGAPIARPEICSISPDGQFSYIPDDTGDPARICVADTSNQVVNNTVLNNNTLSLANPMQVAFSPDRTYAYVADAGQPIIFIIDTATQTITNGLTVSNGVPAIGSSQAIAVRPSPLPPRNLKGVQKINNFGLVYENYTTLTWQASKSALSQYKIYRNHQLMASVGSSVLEYTCHDDPEGDITYAVTSVDDTGEEGDAITLMIRHPFK